MTNNYCYQPAQHSVPVLTQSLIYCKPPCAHLSDNIASNTQEYGTSRLLSTRNVLT